MATQTKTKEAMPTPTPIFSCSVKREDPVGGGEVGVTGIEMVRRVVFEGLIETRFEEVVRSEDMAALVILGVGCDVVLACTVKVTLRGEVLVETPPKRAEETSSARSVRDIGYWKLSILAD